MSSEQTSAEESFDGVGATGDTSERQSLPLNNIGSSSYTLRDSVESRIGRRGDEVEDGEDSSDQAVPRKSPPVRNYRRDRRQSIAESAPVFRPTYESGAFSAMGPLLFICKFMGVVPWTTCSGRAGRALFHLYQLLIFCLLCFRTTRNLISTHYDDPFIDLFPHFSLAVLILVLFILWITMVFWFRKSQVVGNILTVQREVGYMLYAHDEDGLVLFLKDHRVYMKRIGNLHFLISLLIPVALLVMSNIPRISFMINGGDIEEESDHRVFDVPLYEWGGRWYLAILILTDVYIFFIMPIMWSMVSMFYHIFRRHLRETGKHILDPDSLIHTFFFRTGTPATDAYSDFKRMYTRTRAITVQMNLSSPFPEEDENAMGSDAIMLRGRDPDIDRQRAERRSKHHTRNLSIEEAAELEAESVMFRNHFLNRITEMEEYVRSFVIFFSPLILIPCTLWGLSNVVAWVIKDSDGGSQQRLYLGISATVTIIAFVILAANMLKVYRVKVYLVTYVSAQDDDRSTEVKLAATASQYFDIHRMETPDLLHISDADLVRFGLRPQHEVETYQAGTVVRPSLRRMFYALMGMTVALILLLMGFLWTWVLWRSPECMEVKEEDFIIKESYGECSQASYIVIIVMRWFLLVGIVASLPMLVFDRMFDYHLIRTVSSRYYTANIVGIVSTAALATTVHFVTNDALWGFMFTTASIFGFVFYGSYVTSFLITQGSKLKWMIQVMSLLTTAIAVLILIVFVEVPIYVSDPEDDSTRLTIVSLTHPLLTAVALALVLELSDRVRKQSNSQKAYALHAFVKIALSLFERVFLFNLAQISAQAAAVILLAFLEILNRVTAPFRRFAVWSILRRDMGYGYSKMEKYRVSELHSHSNFISQFTELWTLVLGIVLSLLLQYARGSPSPGLEKVALSFMLQFVGEILSTAASTQVDRMYHERNDLQLWALHYKHYFKTSLVSACGVLAIGYGSIVVIAQSYT